MLRHSFVKRQDIVSIARFTVYPHWFYHTTRRGQWLRLFTILDKCLFYIGYITILTERVIVLQVFHEILMGEGTRCC